MESSGIKRKASESGTPNGSDRENRLTEIIGYVTIGNLNSYRKKHPKIATGVLALALAGGILGIKYCGNNEAVNVPPTVQEIYTERSKEKKPDEVTILEDTSKGSDVPATPQTPSVPSKSVERQPYSKGPEKEPTKVLLQKKSHLEEMCPNYNPSEEDRDDILRCINKEARYLVHGKREDQQYLTSISGVVNLLEDERIRGIKKRAILSPYAQRCGISEDEIRSSNIEDLEEKVNSCYTSK